jgi:hypothetical protein
VTAGGERTAYQPPRQRYAVRRTLVALAVLGLLAGLGSLGVFTARWLTGPTCQASAGGQTHAFTPEQMGNASVIAAVALQRGLPARAVTIAMATAIQESGLRNLDHGDRDSVGLFQQRPSQGWGSVEEIMDPVYSAGKFYDALVKVDGYQDLPITEVAQEVQRSAYPSAYADHESEGRVLASTLAGHSPAGLACRLGGAEQPGDTAAIRTAVLAQLGASATAQGRELTIFSSSAEHAWQSASWAVAQAQTYGVQRVTVAGRAWERGRGGLEWSTTDGSATDTTVRITLAD